MERSENAENLKLIISISMCSLFLPMTAIILTIFCVRKKRARLKYTVEKYKEGDESKEQFYTKLSRESPKLWYV